MVDSGDRSRTTWPLALIVALFACAAIILVTRSWGADQDQPRHVAAPDLSTLRASTTDATLKRAPHDPSPEQVPGGVVVQPKSVVALWDQPDGTAFAKLAPEQFGDAWYPVIERRVGWVRVLLPSRPNGSTGWIRTHRVETRRTTDVVRVHLGSRRLELVQDGEVTGTWPVAVGAPETPTPTGRTFILGQLVDDAQSYSPLILPLGTHSQTLDTYGGGPGTVALHGWPDPSVFGQAVSHGCVRVPADALERLAALPLGTPVVIDQA